MAATIVRLARTAMRTRFEFVLTGDGWDAADLNAAGEEALDEVERCEGLLSAYRPDSDLFHINARAGDGTGVRVDGGVWNLLRRARALSEATDGAFDMTVGPLLRVWGLTGESTEVPDTETRNAARVLVGMSDANLVFNEEARTVALTRHGARLDPGAIGKGWALERARDLLREAGVPNALLHGGTSTIAVLGDAPDAMLPGAGWVVAVQHPLRPDVHLAHIPLRDGDALSISAPHGKAVRVGAQAWGHVVAPRTGCPVENGAILAAARAPSPTDTDALSTALLVLGALEGLPLLRARFSEAGFLVAEADAAAEDGARLLHEGLTLVVNP